VRDRIPQFILSLVALLLIASAFVVRPGAGEGPALVRFLAFADWNFSSWFSSLAVFAFILGGLNLMATHRRKIRERVRDWPYSLVTLVSFIVVLVIGLCKPGGAPGLQGGAAAEGTWLAAIFASVLSPLHATLFALLAFYVASASYRTFRARNLETTLLLLSALVVLLGRTPFGAQFTSWLPDSLAFLRIENLSLWILRVPNTAGQRALMIGVALGIVAMSLRMVFGVEKGHKGGGDE
jgi:hypothetical protein